MLLIPFDRRINWRNAPVATLLLIFINLLVFVTLQSEEEQQWSEAIEYYFESGLHEIEYPALHAELERRGEAPAELDEDSPPDPEYLFRMQFEPELAAWVAADGVLAADDPEYAHWRSQRDAFDAVWAEIPSIAYGIKSAAVEVSDLFLHMFMHGDWGHLIGNMLFLFAVGFMVEATLGRLTYLGAYLLCGLGASLPDIAFDLNGLMPSIGASGAIAGLMAMYAVLFGLRRVRFFYFIGVYFDYVKAPAILLLALWLANEIYQQMTWGAHTNINYFAHIGGLLTGALIAAIIKYKTPLVNEDYLAENDVAAERRRRLEQAEGHITALEFEKATPILRELVVERPEDAQLLVRLYETAKYRPEGADYHWAARRILSLREGDAATGEWVRETYTDYLARAKPRALLDTDLVATLARRFLRDGAVEEGERLVRYMASQRARFPELPSYLMLLAKALLRAQQARRGQAYLRLLVDKFPEAAEATAAQELLR
jgi:membrane associated rhomboid family serine protease